MPTRRSALAVLGTAGIGTAAFQRALAAAAEGGAVSSQMVADAEWVAGITLTDPQREAVVNVFKNLARADLNRVRSIEFDNAQLPGLRFVPFASPAARPDPRGYEVKVSGAPGSGAPLPSNPARSEVPAEQADAAKEFKAQRLDSMRRMAERYQLFLGTGEDRPLHFIAEPSLRWTNPVRGARDGSAFLWTYAGRPAAILCIFPTPPATDDQWNHEFHSLSEERVTAVRDDNVVWAPKRAGVEFKPLQGAGVPAATAPRRLSQIRNLAAMFSATVTVRGDTTALRLLTTPLYRYENPRGDVLDGAVFAFTQGTDPELLLALEACTESETRAWRYALARMTMFPLEARYADEPIWSAALWTGGQGNTEPYHTLVRQPAN